MLQFAPLALPVATAREREPKPLVRMATTAMVMFKHPVLLAHGWPQQSPNQQMPNVLLVQPDQDALVQTSRKTVILVFTALLVVKRRDQTTPPRKKEVFAYLATTVTQEAHHKLNAVTAITAQTMPLKPRLEHAGQVFTASETQLFLIRISAPPDRIVLVMANPSNVQLALTVCQPVQLVALIVIHAPLVLGAIHQD